MLCSRLGSVETDQSYRFALRTYLQLPFFLPWHLLSSLFAPFPLSGLVFEYSVPVYFLYHSHLLLVDDQKDVEYNG